MSSMFVYAGIAIEDLFIIDNVLAFLPKHFMQEQLNKI